MVAKNWSDAPTLCRDEDSIVELSLMMSRRQFDVMEQRASAQGISVAQFLRRLVYESTADQADSVDWD